METMLMLRLQRQPIDNSLSNFFCPRLSLQKRPSVYLLTGLIVCVMATLLLSACSTDPQRANTTPLARKVQSPSLEELAHGDVLPGSYLVAFRSEIGGATTRNPSFLTEALLHSQAQEMFFRGDSRVKVTRFLTSLPFATPISQFEQDFQSSAPFAPPISRLQPQDLAEPNTQAGSLLQVDFRSEKEAQEALTEWDSQGALLYAEPNGISQTSNTNSPDFDSLAQKYREQNEWWSTRIALPDAYAELNGFDWMRVASDKGHSPIIAVMDSGVDYDHPALKARIWNNPQKGVAGCDDDLHGCDTTNPSPGRLGKGSVWPYDLDGPGKTCIGKDRNCSHGTHVAGIIAADSSWIPPGSDRPPLGICPVCRLMVLKVVSKVGNQSGILDSSILAALKYVALFRNKRGAQVRLINASFGKFSKSRSVQAMIQALKANGGTLVIGAAGNEDSMRMEYPAAFKDVIAVSAVDEKLRKLSFSNFGSWIDISAPGANITSTVPGQRIDTKSGTSMAAPMVSGVAGLILARYPDLNPNDLRNHLLNSADPTFYGRTYDSEGFNERYYDARFQNGRERQPLLGVGVLNAQAALTGEKSSNLAEAVTTPRVKPGCGTVRGQKNERLRSIWSYLLILIPLPQIWTIWRRSNWPQRFRKTRRSFYRDTI
jgi:subtilisin family serine protease